MLLDVVLELDLVLAKLLCTILTAQGFVGSLGEALGMEFVGDLPLCKYYQGKTQERICIQAGNHDERCAKHGEIPVVNTTGCAATVLHKPCLEWTEEEDANNVTNAVRKSNKS